MPELVVLFECAPSIPNAVVAEHAWSEDADALDRACRQPWNEPADPRPIVDRHRAFVRVRDPDLARVHQLARRLLDLDGALLIFNPSAERLLDAATYDGLEAFAAEQQRIAIDAWTNVRMFALDEVADGWYGMDTLGLAQLGRTDFEAAFPAKIDANEVAVLLKNLALYVAEEGDVFEDDHTTDGPGGTWRAQLSEASLAPPPRPVVRLLPDVRRIPKALTRR